MEAGKESRRGNAPNLNRRRPASCCLLGGDTVKLEQQDSVKVELEGEGRV